MGLGQEGVPGSRVRVGSHLAPVWGLGSVSPTDPVLGCGHGSPQSQLCCCLLAGQSVPLSVGHKQVDLLHVPSGGGDVLQLWRGQAAP